MKYFIIYKGTGEKEVVPEVVGNTILEAKSPKIGWTDKKGRHQIDLAMVGRIIPEEEYYENHPDERPVNIYKELELPAPKTFTKIEGIRATEQLIKGLTKFMSENSHTFKSTNLLKIMEEKLEKNKLLPNNSIIKNPIKEVYGGL